VLATALVPHIGYETAAAIAKRALATGRTIADVALEAGGMTREQLDLALRAEAMLGPAATPDARAASVPVPPDLMIAVQQQHPSMSVGP
jgi:aspartate ammonia-lyase